MKPPKRSDLSTFGLRVWHGSIETPYPPHRHNEVELNVIEVGSFTYILAGQETTITTGELGMFWGAIPHQVIRSDAMTTLYWATIPLKYILDWELPKSFVQALLTGSFFHVQDSLYNLRFFSQWENELASGGETLVLMEIKALFFRFAQLSQPTPVLLETTNDYANKMAFFMSQHFREAIAVNDIAKHVGLHPNYAMAVFKQTFGISLIDYLTQHRIAHAQQLLIAGDEAIIDVALDSGFSTLSHFYVTFKHICGVTPGHYRRSLYR